MEYCLIEAQFLKKYLSHILYCMILYSHQLSHNLWGTYPGASPHFPLTFIVPSLLFISTIYTSISTPMPLTLSHHTCDDYNDSTTIAAFLFPFPCFTAWYVKILYQEGTLFISCVLLVYEKKTLVIKKVLIIDGEHILFVHSMLSISNHVSINKYN